MCDMADRNLESVGSRSETWTLIRNQGNRVQFADK